MSESREQRPPQDMHVVMPMFKAAWVAALVFALAWIRWPLSGELALRVVGIFILFGILITLISMMIGVPIALALAALKVRRWWVYLLCALVTGALLGALFSAHPGVEIDDPLTLTFSPWTRDRPGLITGPLISWPDYVGSIVFGALIGAVLGLAYAHFRGLGAGHARGQPAA